MLKKFLIAAALLVSLTLTYAGRLVPGDGGSGAGCDSGNNDVVTINPHADSGNTGGGVDGGPSDEEDGSIFWKHWLRWVIFGEDE